MDLDALDALKTRLHTAVDDVIAEFTPTPEPTPTILVKAGENLQAYLDQATPDREITIEAGATFEAQRFTFKSGTRLRGAAGVRLHGTAGPAIYIPPGQSDLEVTDLAATANHDVVIKIGDNDATTQGRVEDVPRRIRFTRVSVPEHHSSYAKNAVANNGADVEFIDCPIAEVFNPGGIESHCISTLNTPGGLIVRGESAEKKTVISGSSINLFTGGDRLKLPVGTQITNILYQDLVLTKPVEWKTDGINRNIKNHLEFKHAIHAVVRRVEMSNVWGPIQRGYPLMLTPTLDGSTVDVLYEELNIHDVGAGLNVVGHYDKGPTPEQTTGVVLRKSRFDIDKDAWGTGAPGWFMLISRGLGTMTIESTEIKTNGNALIRVDGAERIASLTIRGCTIYPPFPQYGIATPSGNNGLNWQNHFDALDFSDNDCYGASAAFQKSFPNNRYHAA